jgi:hydrogenase-4 component F
MVGALLLAMMIAPAATALACLVYHQRAFAEALNLAASVVVFATAIPLVFFSARGPYYFLADYVVLDMPGAWVTLCTAVVYLLASIYAVGYMRLLEEHQDKLWSF